MNITKLAALAIAAIVVTGCATTPRTAQFNPNNKSIVFLNGKPYLTPVGSTAPKKTLSNDDIAGMDKGKIPHNCKTGDIMWLDMNYVINANRDYASSEKSKMSKREIMEAVFTNGLKNQRIGCSSPLSAMEYDYYKTAQVQRLQQVRHNQNLQMQQNAINAIDQPTSCITNNGFTTCF